MRLVVLLNENAGGFHAKDGGGIEQTVLSQFAKHGVDVELKIVPGNELVPAARSAVEKAKRKEIDAVVAGGGDGTIAAVAASLVDTAIPLGVLPLGTLNHFARDLGIPFDLPGAVDVITARHTKAVDVAEVNGRIFLNNSSIGVYPFMVLERDRRRRHGRLGKWPAMIWAALKVLRLFPLRRFHVDSPARSETCRTPCLFVGNNEYRLDLLGVGQRERLDGGALWLYIAKQHTRLSLIWFTFRALLGLTQPERDLVCFTAEHATITSRRKALSVATDGEVQWMHPPLDYRTRPRALRVFTRPEQQAPSA